MLKVAALSYRHGDQLIVDHVSLEFPVGNLFGILGPNGSGKTTFMKTVAGIWKASSGDVLWHNHLLLKKSRREISQIITFVPQNPQLTFEYSVEDFVAMGRYARGERENEMIAQALISVDAWHLRARQVQQLSSGERQRVYIARALATEAPVLLLDEPTASLDIRHQLEIWHLLRKLAAQGKLIIVTNHDLEATVRFCDRIAVFHQGSCIASGACSEALTPARVQEVFGVIKDNETYSLK